MSKVKDQMQPGQYDDSKDRYRQVVVAEDVGKIYEVTDDLNMKVKKACESRLSAAWEYTEQRINQINTNINAYNATTVSEGDSITRTSMMSIRTAVEDWVDIFYE